MQKTTLVIIVILIILSGLGYFAYTIFMSKNISENINTVNNRQVDVTTVVDPLNAVYMIEGKTIKLDNGVAQGIIVFGNPVTGDFNNDGVNDAAVILGYNPGGSGYFFYVAAAFKDVKSNTTIGTDAILLGDRIAPQNIIIENGKIIVNFLERKSGEPFTVQPSVGVSKYFILSGSELVEIIGK